MNKLIIAFVSVGLFVGCSGGDTFQSASAENVAGQETGGSNVGGETGTGGVTAGAGSATVGGSDVGGSGVGGNVPLGGTGGNTVCVPKTCDQIALDKTGWNPETKLGNGYYVLISAPQTCGVVDNGCGQQIDCGNNCSWGAVCGASNKTSGLPRNDQIPSICGGYCQLYGANTTCSNRFPTKPILYHCATKPLEPDFANCVPASLPGMFCCPDQINNKY